MQVLTEGVKTAALLPTARGLVLWGAHSYKLQKCYSKCFLQNNACIFRIRALKCGMQIASDSAGINISKTNCMALLEKPQ